jgi:hypothetical protein
MMRVPVTTGASFDIGVPEAAFVTSIPLVPSRNRYRLAPDGQHFLAITPEGDQAKPPITVLLNWSRLLQR